MIEQLNQIPEGAIAATMVVALLVAFWPQVAAAADKLREKAEDVSPSPSSDREAVWSAYCDECDLADQVRAAGHVDEANSIAGDALTGLVQSLSEEAPADA